MQNIQKYVDMYSLTESANSILNGLQVHYVVQSMEKDTSNAFKEEMNKKAYEMAILLHSFGHYDHVKLEEIIQKYGPILKDINQNT